MPLVERYSDWETVDTSFDDPHLLKFDHRFDADFTGSCAGLVNAEE